MKKYKGFTTFLALIFVALPAVSFAGGTYYYGNATLNEAPPVRTEGITLPQNPATVYDTTTIVNNPIAYNGNILGINIKSKAERDAEKAEAEAAKSRAAEEARVARNSDGTFAYGYTNGSGAQYASGANYIDARQTNKSRYTASAGSAMSSSGFFPHTFGGWAIAIILLVILVSIVRAFREKFYTKNKLVYSH